MSNQILFVSLLPILEVFCRCALSDVSGPAQQKTVHAEPREAESS